VIRELIEQFVKMFSWMIVVAPWEQALRIRLGKYVRLLPKGFYFRIPFMDRIYRQSIRWRLDTIRPQTLTTLDNKPVTISSVVGYCIDDLLQLYNTLENPTSTIESRVMAEISKYMTGNNLEECSPDKIEKHLMKVISLEDYGLKDQHFAITSFAVVRTYRLITGDLPSWNRAEEGEYNLYE
jgi:hypothetical protein